MNQLLNLGERREAADIRDFERRREIELGTDIT